MNSIRNNQSGFVFENDEVVMRFWLAKDGWVFLFHDGTKMCVDNRYYDVDLDEMVHMDALRAWYAVSTSLQGTASTRNTYQRVLRGVKTFWPFHVEMEPGVKEQGRMGF